MQYTLAPRPDVPTRELQTSSNGLLGKRVVARLPGGGTQMVLRVTRAQIAAPGSDVLFCAEEAARALGGGGRGFAAEVAKISLVKALAIEKDARFGIITGSLALATSALSGVGIAEFWQWWPAIPAATAFVSALLGVREVKQKIP